LDFGPNTPTTANSALGYLKSKIKKLIQKKINKKPNLKAFS